MAPASRDRLIRETLVLLGAATVYFGVRVVVEGSEARAMRNADRLLSFEEALGIDAERSIQDAVVDSDVLRTLGNLSYVWLHWPLLVVVFVVLLRRDDENYYPLRNALLVSGACGLVLFAAFPVAPPRFLPGYEGTVSQSARTHYLDVPVTWSNRFASFPSFHVGWTTVACMAVAAGARHPAWKAAVLVPAVLVAMAVISTANHYIVDVVVGLALAVGSYVYFQHRRS